MTKSVFAIVMAFLLLLAPIKAYADVIFEPDNDFYKQHEAQILFLGRTFCANGTDGSASVKKEPGAKSDTAEIQNGETTYIQYSCLFNGDYWGFTSEYSGWVKMDQMLVLYDYVAFEEDHQAELYTYSGDYAEIKKTGAAVAWPWPGADAPLWTIENLDTTNFSVTYAYKDEEGREWGFVSYIYGSRNIWVCLSDPMNSDIPAFNPAPPPTPWVSDTVHTDIEKLENPSSANLTLIIILVAALVIGTVVLIKVFWKPNKVEAQIESGGESNE